MTTNPSTRRSFIWTAGAALATPLTIAVAAAPANSLSDENSSETRLAMLEDVNAIRALNQAYARRINAGDSSDAAIDESIVALAADGFEERDVIEIASDRATAKAVVHYIAHIEEVIGPSCPLVEMAREQGGGVVTRTERIVVEHSYIKRDGVWKILRSSHQLTEGVTIR